MTKRGDQSRPEDARVMLSITRGNAFPRVPLVGLGVVAVCLSVLRRQKPDVRFLAAVLAAKSTYRATRLLGRSGGTALPGVIAERVDPAVIAKAARSLTYGAIIVAGTNGKTTTSRLLTEILTAGGYRVINNGAGSNLSRGIAAAFARASGFTGRLHADIAVLETDEAAFPAIAAAVRPRMVVLNNLFRDQLDRYGELNSVATRWEAALAALPPGAVLVYDADDPMLCALAERAAPGIVRVPFGLGAHQYGLPALSHAADSIHCPKCGTPLRYHTLSVGHLGDWYCPTGDNARPPLAFAATAITLDGMDSARFAVTSPNHHNDNGGTENAEPDVETQLPGLYNVYNALGAIAAAITVGVSPEITATAARRFVPPFGRIERVSLHRRRLTLLLIKNPTGANEVLRLLAATPTAPLLIAINDLTADGRDVSWLWDTDFEVLGAHTAPIIVSGIRAADMAVRLKYAGVPEAQITAVPEIADALVAVAERAAPGAEVYVLPTYTAMLAARESLAKHGAIADVWATAEHTAKQQVASSE